MTPQKLERLRQLYAEAVAGERRAVACATTQERRVAHEKYLTELLVEGPPK